MAILHIKEITCNVTEDDTGPDETYITVAGQHFHKWGPVSMNNRQTEEPNLEAAFTNRAVIKVWDEDLGFWPDYHDLLGTHTVNSSQAGAGEKQARFTAYGADYEITYEVR